MWKTDGFDLHLVGNPNSVRTFNLADFLLLGTGQTVAWRPEVTGMSPSRHGVRFPIDGSGAPTGELEMQWQPAVRSLVITAVITPPGDSLPIRIHLHDTLKNFFVTPDELTIRQDARAGFSVLAEFNDGMAADITMHPGLEWNIRSGTGVTLVPSTGMITANTPGQTPEIEVTLPETLYPTSALPPRADRTKAARVRTQPAWDAEELQATFMRGAGAHLWREVPNILFVPDGFVGDEGRKEFERVIYFITDRLHTSSYARPFGTFLDEKAKSLNIFNVWIPSRQDGGNFLSVLKPSPFGETLAARADFSARPRPPAPGQPAKISDVIHLVARVGPPTKADAARDFDEQMAEWNRLYEPAFLDGVNLKIWGDWKQNFPPILALDRDTALGLGHGERPRVEPRASARSPRWHPRRATREQLDKLLRRIVTRSNANPREPIGPTWADEAPGGTPAAGKDATLVYLLTRIPSDGGVRSFDSIREGGPPARDRRVDLMVCSSAIGFGPFMESRPTEGAVLAVRSIRVPRRIHPATWSVVVHELGHSLRLGDEYAKGGVVIPPGSALRTRLNFWNLVVDDQVITNNRLDGSRIPWLHWPRIKAAGLIGGRPTPGGPNNSLTLALRPGHGVMFSAVKAGEIMVLRRRPLVDPARTAASMSPFLTFVSRSGDQIQATAGPFVQEWVNGLTDDEINVKGVILLTGRGQQKQGVELVGVLHEDVASHITTTGRPLNRLPPPDPGGAQCSMDMDAVQRVRNFPAVFGSPRELSRIIGLYDGGASYGCQVYHAQGICMMRAHIPEFSQESNRVLIENGVFLTDEKAQAVATPFCQVCRYILIDQLDPRQHGPFDDEYDAIYPKAP